MWQPKERIKHPPPEPGWPSREQAEASMLFSPVSIGPLTAKQRTWVPAMVPWRATEDGLVTDHVLDWYRRFAAGRPGVIVVEATGIRDVPSGPLLRIGHDRFLPGLRRLTEAVREASEGHTRLFIQCIDFLGIRRRPPKDKYLQRFLAITPAHRERLVDMTGDSRFASADEPEVRAFLCELEPSRLGQILDAREMEDLQYGYRERVWDTHLPHIADLPERLPGLFADAAERARAAGFDGVELHYAHAYTMASFLSGLNTRTDGYGGSREARVRLPLEVIAAVRARVGADAAFVVGVRYLGDEVIAGGFGVDDACYYGLRFAAAGVDFLSLSKGGKFEDAKQPNVGEAAYPYTGPSGYECMPTVFSDAVGPFSRNAHLAAAVKRALEQAGHSHIPVVAAGGIGTFAQAEHILRSGQADIIASARQSLADPDWFLKVRMGRGHEVRRCRYTNYCEGLDQKHRVVTCQLWDRLELDQPDVTLDPTGRRRLVAPAWKPS